VGAVVAAVLAYAIAFQGSRGLWEPDEGRYANIAAQMLRSGDFAVPAFNDDVPHFAKPPLTYWALAAGIAALGWNEWGVRLANALAFAATVLVVHHLGARAVPHRPGLAALVFATFLLPYTAANAVTTDTLLTLWLACAGLAFAAWWERRDGPRPLPPLVAMWLALALAVLTKGPAGLLPLAAFAAFAALAGGRRALVRLLHPAGVVAFAVVGLGWYAAVAATHPGLLAYFVRDELAVRILSGAYRRNPGWYRALETYAPTLVVGALPWALWWVPALRRAGRSLFDRAAWRSRLARRPLLVLAVLWVVVPLAVFAGASSRLPLYLLPLFVPLALLSAAALPEPLRPAVALPLLAVWIAALVGLRAYAADYPSPKDGRPLAAAIAAGVRPRPARVIFVDTRPVWGLSLYLRCEVERIQTRAAVGPTVSGASAQTLRTRLARREAGTVLATSLRDAAAVAAELDRQALRYTDLGTFGDLVLLAPFGDLRPARAR
jgi:4-amino-4-deoxy-L-arabinose transferase-like glycosyltransferase